MDIYDAVQEHAEWKVRFRAAIAKQEQMDAASISKDDCCEVGQWLHGAGKAKLGSTPEFGKAFDAHKAFHVEAGKVAQLINARKYDEAEKALGFRTSYASASSSVTTSLTALKKVGA